MITLHTHNHNACFFSSDIRTIVVFSRRWSSHYVGHIGWQDEADLPAKGHVSSDRHSRVESPRVVVVSSLLSVSGRGAQVHQADHRSGYGGHGEQDSDV